MTARRLAVLVLAAVLASTPGYAAMIGIRAGDGPTALTGAIPGTTPQPLMRALCDPSFPNQICHLYLNDLETGFVEFLFQLFDSTGGLIRSDAGITLDRDSEFRGLRFDPVTFTFTLTQGFVERLRCNDPSCAAVASFTFYVIPNPTLPGEPFRGLDVTGVTPVPEPGTLLLVASGIGSLLTSRVRRRKREKPEARSQNPEETHCRP